MGETDRVTIRAMRAEDCAAVVRLWELAGLPIRPAGRDAQAALWHQLESCPTTYLVAERAGQIVGVVLGTHDQRKGWINRLAVHPDYRRRGLGLRLVSACEEALYALGIGIIATLVEQDNEPSAAFFRRAGYVTDVPVHYFRKRRYPEV